MLYKQRAFDELIAALMTRDPSGAAAWITQMGRQSFMSGDGIPELAAQLAGSSPTEALRWLDTLGSGTGEAAGKTNQGFARVLSTWAEKDPVAAGTWLQSQSGHPAYNDMAATYSSQLAATDGASALAWADSIPDEARRNAARDDAARAVLRSNDENGRAALAAAGYTEARVEELNRSKAALMLYTSKLAEEEQSRALRQWMDVSIKEQQLLNPAHQELYSVQETIADEEWNSRLLAFSPNGEHLSGETGNHFKGTADSPAYARAHPNGAPANCAQCHQ